MLPSGSIATACGYNPANAGFQLPWSNVVKGLRMVTEAPLGEILLVCRVVGQHNVGTCMGMAIWRAENGVGEVSLGFAFCER